MAKKVRKYFGGGMVSGAGGSAGGSAGGAGGLMKMFKGLGGLAGGNEEGGEVDAAGLRAADGGRVARRPSTRARREPNQKPTPVVAKATPGMFGTDNPLRDAANSIVGRRRTVDDVVDRAERGYKDGGCVTPNGKYR